MKAILVLVCKRPRPGEGKQRLAAKLGITATCLIAQALLDCALEDALSWRGPVVIAPATKNDATWAAGLLATASHVTVCPQTQGNLGQRLNVLDETLRQRGMSPLIFIGSDAPLLSSADYAECLASLLDYQTALKPATDGGVVMMASHLPWPPLDKLPWSTDQLGKALLNCCRQFGQTVSTLSTGMDVDQPQDIARLCTQLKNDPRPARQRLLALVSTLTTNDDPGVCY